MKIKILLLITIMLFIFSIQGFAMFPFMPNPTWKTDSLLDNVDEMKDFIEEENTLKSIKAKKKQKKEEMKHIFEQNMKLGPNIMNGNPNVMYIQFKANATDSDVQNILNSFGLKSQREKRTPLFTTKETKQVVYVKAKLKDEIEVDTEGKELEDETIKLLKINKIQDELNKLEKESKVEFVLGDMYINSFNDLLPQNLWEDIYTNNDYIYHTTLLNSIKKDNINQNINSPLIKGLPTIEYDDGLIKRKEKSRPKVKLDNQGNNSLENNLPSNPKVSGELLERLKEKKRIKDKEVYMKILYNNYAFNYNDWIYNNGKWSIRDNVFTTKSQKELINNAEKLLIEAGNRMSGKGFNEKGYKETHTALLNLKAKLLNQLQKALIDRNRLIYIHSINEMDKFNEEKLKEVNKK